MNFFSTHYEKVILLSFLILFIVLLLLQVNFMQNVQNQKINAIMQKVEPPTDQKVIDYNVPKYKLESVFNSAALWNKGTAAAGGGPKTELLSCFELSVCPFCNDLIRSDNFPTVASPTTKNCPVCDQELKQKMKRQEVQAANQGDAAAKEVEDKNNNSVPDKWEVAYKVYSNSGSDIDRDHDNDGFTTWEEYKCKPQTNPNDPKSHPAYIDCIAFSRLNTRTFVNLRFRGVYSRNDTKDVNKWKLRMEYQRVNDRRRRMSTDFSVGSIIEHGNETFEIIECSSSGAYVIIRRTGTKERIRCDYLKEVQDPVKTVTFRNSHPESTINCKIGGTFALGSSRTGRNVYKVISATHHNAVVMDVKSNKRYTIKTVQKLPMIEPRQGAASTQQSRQNPGDNGFSTLSTDENRPGRASRRRRGGRR